MSAKQMSSSSFLFHELNDVLESIDVILAIKEKDRFISSSERDDLGLSSVQPGDLKDWFSALREDRSKKELFKIVFKAILEYIDKLSVQTGNQEVIQYFYELDERYKNHFLEKKKKDPEPRNFRKNTFTLAGEKTFVVGMAGPHNDPVGVEFPLLYLKKQGVRVLIGLHEEKDFSAESQALGIQYHHIALPDYQDMPGVEPQPIDPDCYDKIYSIVTKAMREGEHVAIHCGSGDGRTGTALASLKLRELIEKEAKENAKLETTVPEKTVTVVLMHGNHTLTTPLVAAAIAAIRSEGPNGKKSVENANDVRSLEGYERYVVLNMQKSSSLALGVSSIIMGQLPTNAPRNDGKAQLHEQGPSDLS